VCQCWRPPPRILHPSAGQPRNSVGLPLNGGRSSPVCSRELRLGVLESMIFGFVHAGFRPDVIHVSCVRRISRSNRIVRNGALRRSNQRTLPPDQRPRRCWAAHMWSVEQCVVPYVQRQARRDTANAEFEIARSLRDARSGGAAETVRDGKSGFLFPVGDTMSLVSPIEMTREPLERGALGRAASKSIVAHSSVDRVLESDWARLNELSLGQCRCYI